MPLWLRVVCTVVVALFTVIAAVRIRNERDWTRFSFLMINIVSALAMIWN